MPKLKAYLSGTYVKNIEILVTVFASSKNICSSKRNLIAGLRPLGLGRILCAMLHSMNVKLMGKFSIKPKIPKQK